MMLWTRSGGSCWLSADGRFRITRQAAGHMLEDRRAFAAMKDSPQAAKDAADQIVLGEEAAARRSRTWAHLAFTGARYAICGALPGPANPVTASVADADCPDCLKEHRDAEAVHEGLHRVGMRADYEA